MTFNGLPMSTMERIIPMDEVLLSIDWDFFFPEPHGTGARMSMQDQDMWDWPALEEGDISTKSATLWKIRAARFIMAGLKLPTSDSLLQQAVLNKFDLSKVQAFYLADSHKHAYTHPSVHHRYSQIISLDAHHDLGYSNVGDSDNVSCEDWLMHYHSLGVKDITVVYPDWKKRAFKVEPDPYIRSVPRMFFKKFCQHTPGKIVPTRVFICQSSAWTPTWTDEAFERFCIKLVQKAEQVQRKNFRPYKLEPMGLREFNLDHVKALAEHLTKAKEQFSSKVSENHTSKEAQVGQV